MAFTSISIDAPQEAALGNFVDFSVTIHRNNQGEMTVGQIKTVIMLNDNIQPPNQWTYEEEQYAFIPINSSKTYNGAFLMKGTQVRIVVWTYYWWYGDSSYHKDSEQVEYVKIGTTPPEEWVKVASDYARLALVGGGDSWLQVLSATASIVAGAGAAGWYQVASNYASVYVGEPVEEPSAFPWTWVVIGGVAVMAGILLMPKGKGGQPIIVMPPQQPQYQALPPGRGERQ